MMKNQKKLPLEFLMKKTLKRCNGISSTAGSSVCQGKSCLVLPDSGRVPSKNSANPAPRTAKRKTLIPMLIFIFTAGLCLAPELPAQAPFDNWLVLDGADDYAACPSSADLALAEPSSLTVEVWFQTYNNQPYPSEVRPLVVKRGAWELSIEFGASYFGYWDCIDVFLYSNDNSRTGTGYCTSLGTGWHHVAMVLDNSANQLNLYLDGNRVNSITKPTALRNSAHDVEIGRSYFDSNTWDGLIDEVRISNCVRYSGPSYTVPSAGFACDGFTPVLWHFNECAGATLLHDGNDGAGSLCGTVEDTLAGMNGAQTDGSSPCEYIISGTILTGALPLANVVLNGLPGNPATNGSGVYTANVGASWSGTVTPFLAGYNFTPVSRNYTNVNSDQAGQDYSGAPAASLQLISPNGGESWTAGTTRTITWSSTGPIANVRIEYSTNNGSAWSDVTTSTPDDGNYSWTIPGTTSVQCLVRISDAGNASINDTSNTAFTICGYTISPGHIIYPAGGGNGSISVSTCAGCTWDAESKNSWIQVTDGFSGSGDGLVEYSVDVNPGPVREGMIVIANLAFRITQDQAEVLPCTEFMPPAFYAMGAGPNGVVLSDFNEDGILDVAVDNEGSHDVSIRLGLGSGMFGDVMNFSLGSPSGPQKMVVADFNRDGHQDIAVSSLYQNAVSILFGTGMASFSPVVHFPAGIQPRGIAVGDVNADGADDLVTANSGGASISVLINDGHGGFAPAVNYGLGDFSYTLDVALGDLTGDGVPDLAVTDYGMSALAIFPGLGGGSFNPAYLSEPLDGPRGLILADFNGNGTAGVAVTISGYPGEIQILLNSPEGFFDPAIAYQTGDEPSFLAAGKFNSDNFLDLAVPNAGQSSRAVSIFSGTGIGTFQSAGALNSDWQPYAVAVGDLNGDLYDDLVVSNHGGNNVAVFLNARCGLTSAFAVQLAQYLAGNPESASGMDVNQDGTIGILDLNFLLHLLIF